MMGHAYEGDICIDGTYTQKGIHTLGHTHEETYTERRIYEATYTRRAIHMKDIHMRGHVHEGDIYAEGHRHKGTYSRREILKERYIHGTTYT